MKATSNSLHSRRLDNKRHSVGKTNREIYWKMIHHPTTFPLNFFFCAIFYAFTTRYAIHAGIWSKKNFCIDIFRWSAEGNSHAYLKCLENREKKKRKTKLNLNKPSLRSILFSKFFQVHSTKRRRLQCEICLCHCFCFCLAFNSTLESTNVTNSSRILF